MPFQSLMYEKNISMRAVGRHYLKNSKNGEDNSSFRKKVNIGSKVLSLVAAGEPSHSLHFVIFCLK